MKAHALTIRILAALLLGMIALSAALPAAAFEGRSGDEVVIAAGEVIDDDLYITATTIRVDGRVTGDLVALGTTVVINGIVEGDLFAGGQEVMINGQVGDDVRVGGMAVTLGPAAVIGDDLLAGAYSVETLAGSTVAGDMLFGAAQGLLAGTVAGDLTAGVNGLELHGTIGGDVSASVGTEADAPPFSPFMFMPDAPAMPSVAGGMTVADGAEIGGRLEYSSQIEAVIPTGIAAEGVTFSLEELPEPVAAVQEPTLLDRTLERVRIGVALFLVGLLMLWLAPKVAERTTALLRERTLPSLGWGVVSIGAFVAALLAVIVVVVAAAIVLGLITLDNLIGAVTSVGLLAAFGLIVAFSLAVGFFAKVFVCCEAGRWILNRINPAWTEQEIWPLLLGVVLFVLLTAIPYVGGLINFVVILFGLGALWLFGREFLAARRMAPAAV